MPGFQAWGFVVEFYLEVRSWKVSHWMLAVPLCPTPSSPHQIHTSPSRMAEWCLKLTGKEHVWTQANEKSTATCFNALHSLLIYTWFSWWLNGQESTCQCRRFGPNPWVMKIPWRRKWQPTPVFLPGKSHVQRSLVGYSHWVAESDMT